MNSSFRVRDWMFRSLMFESEAERFRDAGIKVGVDGAKTEQILFEQELAPFQISLRARALAMGRLYALIYCFENSVRVLIRERLTTKVGSNWWVECVPEKIRKMAESRRKSAEENSWLRGEASDLLDFVDFGHLASVITQNWDSFADLIPNQPWLAQRFDELEKARNFVAHNRMLSRTEFARLELYVADWNAQVGF